jgi:benzoylformate decarboxylase
MRELAARFLKHGLSRRDFVKRLTALGFSASAAGTLLTSFETVASDSSGAEATGRDMGEVGELRTGTGGELLVAQARAAGVEYLFTNPGSFEVGLFDAVVDDQQIHLIEGLHEGIVISAADGYHKVSGKPALVNVHVIAGTAQMAGQLYNAARDGSALVVTAGLIDNEVWNDDSVLAPRPGFDQKEVNRQFTKISWEARQAASVPMMLRRAFKIATTSPGGPTYLAVARAALESKGVIASILPAQRFLTPSRAHPSPQNVQRAAKRLVECRRPLLVAGDEVWKCSAQQDLLELAELLGIGVSQPFENARFDLAAFKSFPTHHALALTAREGTQLAADGADVVVFVGARDPGFDMVPKEPGIPPPVRVVRVGVDAASLGRIYATDEALVGDVKLALEDLSAAVKSSVTEERRLSIIAARRRDISALTEARRSRTDREIVSSFGQSPIHPNELSRTLSDLIDRDAIVVSENLSERYESFRFGFRQDERIFLGTGGASLGWGIGAATGAKLAAPDRQVVCCTGDGSVMYSASGFWTQARYHIPVLTVVWNNRNYQTVRHAYHDYQGRMATSGKYAAMYLGNPDIDFVKLAASQGVPGERVQAGHDLRASIRRGISATRDGKPYLIEVLVARVGGGAASTWHETFNLASRRTRPV